MENIIRLITQLGLISIYPIILLVIFLYISFKKEYLSVIKKHYKSILINTFLAILFGAILILVYFHFEDTIYRYDYAGHWIRALELREMFYTDPSSILSHVYSTMLYNDYSSLPALFGLGFIIFNEGYTFFALTNYMIFVLPVFILLQIIYFKYSEKSSLIPLFAFVALYPFYFNVLFGKVDAGGMFFLVALYMILILPDFKSISIADNLFANIPSFILVFFRRWYLYPLIILYLIFFIKYILHYKKNIFTKEGVLSFLKIISSGLLMLCVILIWFMPFFERVLNNNFSEAYEMYNHGNKLLSFFNYISPIISILSISSLFVLYKFNKKFEVVALLFSIVFPTIALWSTQSLEYHHYYMFMPSIYLLLAFALKFLFDKKRLFASLLVLLLFGQALNLYFYNDGLPFFTKIKKVPEVLNYKDDVINLSSYLTSLMNENEYAYLASGSYRLNDDLIRNALLPNLDAPGIDFAVLDLRDGFPKDLENIRYVILLDPILYTDQDYQHIYDVITNAVLSEPIVSDIYDPIYNTTIHDIDITVYERIAPFSLEIKQYFYDEMLNYYPDKADFFAYILE